MRRFQAPQLKALKRAPQELGAGALVLSTTTVQHTLKSRDVNIFAALRQRKAAVSVALPPRHVGLRLCSCQLRSSKVAYNLQGAVDRPARCHVPHLWSAGGAAGVTEAARIILIYPHPLEPAQVLPLCFHKVLVAQAALQACLFLQRTRRKIRSEGMTLTCSNGLWPRGHDLIYTAA